MIELLAAFVVVASPTPQECSDLDGASLSIATRPARQGQAVPLYASTGLHGMNALPMECFSDWRTSDPALTFSDDHSEVRIGRNARAGTAATVSARIGERRFETRFRIVGADEPSLIGFWKQESADCEGATPDQPLRELRFDPTGGYSVTFVPFETRKDYWGPVAFDPASGRIAFTVETSNMPMPPTDLEGRARLEGPDRLVMDDLYFGGLDAAPSGGCRYVFVRS